MACRQTAAQALSKLGALAAVKESVQKKAEALSDDEL